MSPHTAAQAVFTHDDLSLWAALGNKNIVAEVLREFDEDRKAGRMTQVEYDEAVTGIQEAVSDIHAASKDYVTAVQTARKAA